MSTQPDLPGTRTVNDILTEMERPTRTNSMNDGRSFQVEIKKAADFYASRGRARLRKVDPPTRIVGGGAYRRVIFLENPWLDFCGCWTERSGRAIFIEAKSTKTNRLPLFRNGGLTETQWTSMQAWEKAGAATGVLWRHPNGCAFLWPQLLRDQRNLGAASIKSEQCDNVSLVMPGIFDFLPFLGIHD